MQSIARGFAGTYRTAVPTTFISSLLGTIALIIAAFWYQNTGENNLAIGFSIAAIIFPFMHGLTIWQGAKTGTEDFQSLLKLQGSTAVIMHTLMIAAILLVPGSYHIPLLMLMIVPAILNVMMIITDLKAIPRDAPTEANNIAYGIKTTLYGAFNTVAKHMDKILLFLFLSPASLATFVAADRLADLLRNSIQDVGATLAARFAKHDHYSEELDKILKLFCLVIGIAIVIFAFTFAPWILTTIFGEAYSDAIPYMQALMCSVAIANIATLRFRYIRSKLDDKSYRNIVISTSMIRIITSLVLIPLYGLIGAVISTFVYRVVMTVIVGITMKTNYAFKEG